MPISKLINVKLTRSVHRDCTAKATFIRRGPERDQEFDLSERDYTRLVLAADHVELDENYFEVRLYPKEK